MKDFEFKENLIDQINYRVGFKTLHPDFFAYHIYYRNEIKEHPLARAYYNTRYWNNLMQDLMFEISFKLKSYDFNE